MMMFINSQGIVNAVTLNGFFWKFQGAPALCLSLNCAFDWVSVPSRWLLLTCRGPPSCGRQSHVWVYAPQAPETIGSSKLLGRVGKKQKPVELAIKYEWHILFNFACHFFLVHPWGFNDIVTQHSAFVVQGMPSWRLCWFGCETVGLWSPANHLVFWSITPPSKLGVGER